MARPKKNETPETETDAPAVDVFRVTASIPGIKTRKLIRVAAAHCDVNLGELAEFALLTLLSQKSPEELADECSKEALLALRDEAENS